MNISKQISRWLVVAGVLVVAGCLLLGGCSSDESASGEAWEYQMWRDENVSQYSYINKKRYTNVVLFSGEKEIYDTELSFYNIMGWKGWELVNKEVVKEGNAEFSYMIFKRRRRS